MAGLSVLLGYVPVPRSAEDVGMMDKGGSKGRLPASTPAVRPGAVPKVDLVRARPTLGSGRKPLRGLASSDTGFQPVRGTGVPPVQGQLPIVGGRAT
jgi:hypothetical protein